MRKSILFIFLSLLCPHAFAAHDLGAFHRGEGSLVYTGYAPLADKPVTVYYYIPSGGNVKNMPVLIAFHGAEREGKNPRDNWKDFAEKDGFVVLVPEFTKALFDENAYQFGGVYKDRTMTELKPEEEWTYSIIEPIFDYFQSETGNKAKTYSIQGHSAGGQFTHRYLIAKPHARVDVAVASNPGSWTYLNTDGHIRSSEESWGWPYTVKDTPFADEEHIKAYLARNLTVHVGDADTLTAGPYVPTSQAALAEGPYRYLRGVYYFEQTKALSQTLGMPFHWGFMRVGGVGHRGKGMIYAKSHFDSEGKRHYDVNEVRKSGAYSIIFGN